MAYLQLIVDYFHHNEIYQFYQKYVANVKLYFLSDLISNGMYSPIVSRVSNTGGLGSDLDSIDKICYVNLY